MRRLAALLLALIFLLGGCTFSGTGDAGGDILTIHFIDVGQADCTLLICGETTILIDAGNTDDGHMVCSYLDSLGVDEIDLAIATHAHEDHLGGYASVFYDFEVKQVWASPQEYPSSYAYKNFINGVANQGLTLLTPDPGHTYSSDGIQITVLGPVKDYYDDRSSRQLFLHQLSLPAGSGTSVRRHSRGTEQRVRSSPRCPYVPASGRGGHGVPHGSDGYHHPEL